MREREGVSPDHAATARRMFSRVSREYPASAFAQAARIADLCGEIDAEPSVLYEALQQDNGIEEFYESVKHIHTKFQSGPSEISELQFRDVLETVFTKAEVMVDLPPGILITIQKRYDEIVRPYLRTPEKNKQELVFNIEVNEIVHAAKEWINV